MPILGGQTRLLYAERHAGLLRLKPSRSLARVVGDFRMTIHDNDLDRIDRIYPIIGGVHTHFLRGADPDSFKSAVLRAAGCTRVTNHDIFEGLGVYNQRGKPCERVLADSSVCWDHVMGCTSCEVKICATIGVGLSRKIACRSCIDISVQKARDSVDAETQAKEVMRETFARMMMTMW